MKYEELINNNYLKKSITNEKGYIETSYFDANWNYTTEDKSFHKIIKSFDINGNQIDEDIIDNKDINKLNETITYERINLRTPSGGDYYEAHFFDNEWKYTTKDKTVNVIIRECKEDGTLVKETFMHRNNKEVDKNMNK